MIEYSIRKNDVNQVNLINDMFDTRLFISRSIKQLLEGYEDDLLELANEYLPDIVKSSKFSLMLDVRMHF